jgi:transcriptional regulator with XRE-family HTH domain
VQSEYRSEFRIDPSLFASRIKDVVRDEPKAFAYDLGLSLSAVYNYLNGRIPTTDVLFRIAQYAGRPMEWFLTADTAGANAKPAIAA